MVGFGTGGGDSTHDRPQQGGFSRYWAPKKGTNTSLIDHIGARSSKGVSGDSNGAAHANSGVGNDINKTNARPNVRSAKHGSAPTSSDLNGSAPASSNPAIGAHLKSLLSLGRSLPSSGRQDEHVRKGDLQGSALAGDGYVHCTPDFPATINSEIANDPVKSWKSLVSMPVKTGGPLQFCMPQCVDGMIVAKPSVEAVNEGIDMWKGCLVGQFLDKRLPFPVVRSLVNRLWGKREMPEISTTENGLFFFRFRDPEARDWVMDAEPWHLAGRPFILRAWKPGMDMLNIQLSSIPIWVRFYNIPLEYWTSTCLGHITSTVGIPLHLDPLTENQTKLSFSRICIEVGVDCVFPKYVLLDKGNGNYSTIRIEYPWAPKCCSECKLFGHNLGNCKVRKSPSCGITATNPENSKHEATAGQDIEDVGEGMELATGNSTNSADSVATTPTITHAESESRLDAKEVAVAIKDDVPPKLQGNSFACLALSEEEGPTVEEEPLPVPIVSTDFSDTSPIIDTFRHIKRVDELDFTPVPLSKKNLKKLKKRSPVNMQDPVMGGTQHLPNG